MTVQNHVLGLDQVGIGGQLADVQVIDEAMLAGFYETNVEKLLRFLARKAGRDDGAEILSQVFEEFFVWWPEDPAHPNPLAMLYRITRCRLNDHLRRLGRVETLDADDLAAAADGAHHDELADVVRRADLRVALRELTERERQALGLRYVADLPVKECAEVMEVGIDNMKKILKTALNKLRQSPRMEGYKIITTAKEARQ